MFCSAVEEDMERDTSNFTVFQRENPCLILIGVKILKEEIRFAAACKQKIIGIPISSILQKFQYKVARPVQTAGKAGMLLHSFMFARNSRLDQNYSELNKC